MSQENDSTLLREFARNQSESAFAELVTRYVNLVYSVAVRQVGDAHHAREITQAVFIILARKAGGLRHDRALSSWLFQTTRLTANNFLRSEQRRQRREQEAYMQSTLNEPGGDAWPHIAPLLDSAVETLGEADRRAIMLRFYEGRNLREVGVALDTSEDAAKMRVNRALEKLRKFFGRQGVTLSVGAIAAVVSANSVQAAPAGLAQAVSTVAAAHGAAASASTLVLVKGALNLMTWTKMKIAGLGIGLALAAVTTTAVVVNWDMTPKALAGNPPVVILRPTELTNGTGGVSSGEGTSYRLQFQNVSMQLLLASAFHGEEYREVLPAGLPLGNYDFMYTLPGKAYGWDDGLRKEFKRQFGVTAHFETRMTRAWLLTAPNLNTNLVLTAQTDENQQEGNFRNVIFRGASMDIVRSWTEAILKTPVIDCTGLTNHFDTAVKWLPTPGQTEAAAIKQVLQEKYGFAFTETNLPLRVLVVERTP